jgi:hypothetical protein
MKFLVVREQGERKEATEGKEKEISSSAGLLTYYLFFFPRETVASGSG